MEVGGLLEEASSACREKGLVLPVLGDSCCCKGPTGFAPPLDLPLLLGSVFDPTVSPEERAASVAEPTLPSDLLLKSARRFSPDGGGASCGALGGEGDLAAQTMQISSALIANLLLSVENRQFLAGFSKQQTQLALLRASAAAAESLCGPVTEDALANCSDALAAQTEERSAVADEQTDLESDLVETAAAVLSEVCQSAAADPPLLSQHTDTACRTATAESLSLRALLVANAGRGSHSTRPSVSPTGFLLRLDGSRRRGQRNKSHSGRRARGRRGVWSLGEGPVVRAFR